MNLDAMSASGDAPTLVELVVLDCDAREDVVGEEGLEGGGDAG